MSINLKNIKYEIIEDNSGYFHIMVNNKNVKTPLDNLVTLPSLKVAKRVLKNIKCSGKKNIVSDLKISFTAIDKVSVSRDEFISNMTKSLQTDVLIFFAEHQKDLFRRQKKLWMPLLEWFNKEFGFKLSYSKDFNINFLSDSKIQKVINILKTYNVYELAALYSLINITNSFIVSFALFEDKITYRRAFNVSFLEELYQASIWGKDDEAFTRLNSIKLDIKCVKDYFDSINS